MRDGIWFSVDGNLLMVEPLSNACDSSVLGQFQQSSLPLSLVRRPSEHYNIIPSYGFNSPSSIAYRPPTLLASPTQLAGLLEISWHPAQGCTSQSHHA